MPEQAVSRTRRNIVKTCLLAWLAATNAGTFVEAGLGAAYKYDNKACDAFSLSAYTVNAVKEHSLAAANVIAFNQGVIGLPGHVVGSVLVGFGARAHEVLTIGTVSKPRSCP